MKRQEAPDTDLLVLSHEKSSFHWQSGKSVYTLERSLLSLFVLSRNESLGNTDPAIEVSRFYLESVSDCEGSCLKS